MLILCNNSPHRDLLMSPGDAISPMSGVELVKEKVTEAHLVY